jgi:hypothetical protein
MYCVLVLSRWMHFISSVYHAMCLYCHTHTYIHTHMHVHLLKLGQTLFSVFTMSCVSIVTRTHTYIHTYMHACMSTNQCNWCMHPEQIRSCVSILGHTYMYILTHMHKHTYACSLWMRSEHTSRCVPFWATHTCILTHMHKHICIYIYIYIYIYAACGWASNIPRDMSYFGAHIYAYWHICIYIHVQAACGCASNIPRDMSYFGHTYMHSDTYSCIHTYICSLWMRFEHTTWHVLFWGTRVGWYAVQRPLWTRHWYVCMYVCMFCLLACASRSDELHTYLCVYIYTYMYIYIVYAYICWVWLSCICVCVYIYIHCVTHA